MIVVRPGTAADHEAAVHVWSTADTARRRGASAPLEHEDRVRSRFGIPHTWLLVADDDGAVVGVASGMPARADDGAGDVIAGLCHLSLVFVLPNWWGRGVGGQLVDAALAETRTRAYQRHPAVDPREQRTRPAAVRPSWVHSRRADHILAGADW